MPLSIFLFFQISVLFLLYPYCEHTHTQPFYDSVDFVRINHVEPVPEETFTHNIHPLMPIVVINHHLCASSI